MPIAGNTKTGLSAASHNSLHSLKLETSNGEYEGDSINRLSLAGISGITAYEPSEFLITAQAGTKIQELKAALGEHGQYLPFDPMYVSEGATLGGTIASGISGPSCLLYGGLRDFVMEVELIDGLGKRCRGGGKVVKNAAGFDLPKLVCGSYGRLGVLTEATLKVLPQPKASWSLTTRLKDLPTCVQAIQKLRAQPLPISSLDVLPNVSLQIQVAGPEASLESVTARIRELISSDWTHSADGDSPHMSSMDSSPFLIRVATDVEQIPSLAAAVQKIAGTKLAVFCGGGTIAWISAEDLLQIDALDASLNTLKCAGVVVRGRVDGLRVLGRKEWVGAARRIQSAIDPNGRFASY